MRNPDVRAVVGGVAVAFLAISSVGHARATAASPERSSGQAAAPRTAQAALSSLPASLPDPPRVRYTIDCQIDLAGTVKGTETAVFVNGRRPLPRLALAWSAKADPAFDLTLNGRPVTAAEVSPSEGPSPQMVVELPHPIAPGSTVTLKARFSRPFHLDRYGRVNLLTWHPRIWWGRETHDDFDLKTQPPPGCVFAASAPLDPSTGRYAARHVRSFAVILAKDHEVMEAKAGDVVVRAVHTKAGAQCARLLLDTATDVIGFYRTRFGFYPQRSLTIIPGSDQPMGGYPVATGIVVVHGQEKFEAKPPSFWKWITAHEIGHQYWLEHVLSADREGGWGWLMIGMGIYADREYCRARGITDQHKQFFTEYTDAVRKGIDTTVDLTPEQLQDVKFDFNNIVTHGKGFSIISALEVTLGHDTFERVYRRCLREGAGRPLGLARFQSVCESEAGEPLDWFFDQWVRSNRYLAYETAGQSTGRVANQEVTQVVVKRTGTLSMPVPVVATFADGSTKTQFTDRLLASQIVTFRAASAPKEVKIDPAGELAMVIPPPPPTAMDLTRRLGRLDYDSAGEEAVEIYWAARQTSLVNGSDWYRLGLMLYGGHHYEEGLGAMQEAARVNTGRGEQAAILWQGHLLDLLGRRDEALKCYQLALDKGFVGPIRHDQWNMVIDRKWVEERLTTPFTRK